MISSEDLQQLLTEAGHYDGSIDGIEGEKTMAAVIAATGGSRPSRNYARQRVAAAQTILTSLGFEPGKVDGWWGQLTEHAMSEWRHKKLTGKKLLPWRQGTDDQYREKYGPPGGSQCTAGKVIPPFPLRLAWSLDKVIRRFSCHEMLEEPMQRVYERVWEEYPADEVARHGFNIWGGCFNHRKMRGGSSLSTHSWGAAVDTDPERNRLRWGSDRAYLAKPECRLWWEIWESEGFVSLGRTRDYDWMHVQADA